MSLSASMVFIAGLLTFLSPCVLPIVPIYLSILAGSSDWAERSKVRPLISTLAFIVGFSIVFSLLGLSATVVGRFLIRHKMLFQQLAGIFVLLLGLRFMGYLRLPFLPEAGLGETRLKTRFHYLNSFVLGLLFAFAWTPCVGSILGAVLTYTSLKTTDPFEGMAWLMLYSLGFGIPLLIVAIFAGPALSALRKAKRFLPLFEKTTGLILVVSGLLLVTDKWGLLDAALTRPPEDPSPLRSIQSQGPGVEGVSGACTEGGATQCAVGEEDSKRPSVIKFYSPSCPICLQMVPVVNALKNECAGKNLDFRDVDVSTPEGRILAREYGVTGIPVFLFLNKEGKEVARLVGFQTLSALEQAASVLLGEQCPSFRPLPDLTNSNSSQRSGK